MMLKYPPIHIENNKVLQSNKSLKTFSRHFQAVTSCAKKMYPDTRPITGLNSRLSTSHWAAPRTTQLVLKQHAAQVNLNNLQSLLLKKRWASLYVGGVRAWQRQMELNHNYTCWRRQGLHEECCTAVIINMCSINKQQSFSIVCIEIKYTML